MNLQPVVSGSEAQATTLACDWHLKWAGLEAGQSCKSEPLTSRIWYCLWVDSVRDSLLVSRELLAGVGKLPFTTLYLVPGIYFNLYAGKRPKTFNYLFLKGNWSNHWIKLNLVVLEITFEWNRDLVKYLIVLVIFWGLAFTSRSSVFQIAKVLRI